MFIPWRALLQETGNEIMIFIPGRVSCKGLARLAMDVPKHQSYTFHKLTKVNVEK